MPSTRAQTIAAPAHGALPVSAAELALDLDRDGHAFARIVQDGIDPAAGRPAHGDLGEDPPPGMEDAQERLEHAGLMAIADERAGVRVRRRRATRRVPRDQKPRRIRSGSFRSRFDAVPVKNPTSGSPSATQ